MSFATCFSKTVFLSFGLIGLSMLRATAALQADTQVAMNTVTVTESERWTVSLSQDWDVRIDDL